MCVRERRGSNLFGAEVPPLLRGCSVQWQHLCHFLTSFSLLFFCIHTRAISQVMHVTPPQGDAAQLPLSDTTHLQSRLLKMGQGTVSRPVAPGAQTAGAAGALSGKR